MNFNDSMLVKTSNFKEWMNAYVNLYGSLAKTQSSIDSLFSAAGVNAIEQAKKGHPIIYGWMVDYFFNGYEANGIDAGMKVLEPYIKDPNCLTAKRIEINRRLEAIASLVPGTKAPAINMKDMEGKNFDLHKYSPDTKYILVVFWSAGCFHCVETIDVIYPWYKQDDNSKKLSVVAVSLDENEDEIKKYNTKHKELAGWIHLHAKEGVNSQVANDYGILSTPVMFLIDTKNKQIIASPNSLEQLKKEVKP